MPRLHSRKTDSLVLLVLLVRPPRQVSASLLSLLSPSLYRVQKNCPENEPVAPVYSPLLSRASASLRCSSECKTLERSSNKSKLRMSVQSNHKESEPIEEKKDE